MIGQVPKNNILLEKRPYEILRDAFIDPSHLPLVVEGELRADFDFAEYIAAVYDKTLKKLFNTAILTYLAILILIMIWLAIVSYLSIVPQVNDYTNINISFCSYSF